MRAKSILLIVIALGCGTVASIGISQVVNRPQGQVAEVETEKIFVAAADIDIRDPLNPQNLKLEEWPLARIPEGAITALDQVEGRYARQRLYRGEPILERKLMGVDAASSPDTLIPDGYRLKSVRVTAASAASGFIFPGSRVDVLLFVKSGREIQRTMVKTILRDVRVFGVDQQIQRAVDQEGNAISAKTITLIVSPDQVERLTLASAVGSLELALRPPSESDEVETDGKTVSDLLQDAAEDGDDSDPGGQPISDTANSFLALLQQQDTPIAASVAPQMSVLTPTSATHYTFDENGTPVPVGGSPTTPPAQPATSSTPNDSGGAAPAATTGQGGAATEQDGSDEESDELIFQSDE